MSKAQGWLASLGVVAVVASGGTASYLAGWTDEWVDSSVDAVAGWVDGIGQDEVAAPIWESPVPGLSDRSPDGDTSNKTPDSAAVSAAVTALLRDGDLGDHVVAQVAALDGTTLAQVGSGAATPASTTKVLTGAAALAKLGAATTFATTVVSPEPGRLVVVGGGDPLLAAKPLSERQAAVLPRADLTTLATEVAQTLKATATTTVRLDYDESLFAGPTTAASWPGSYVTENVVSPVSALRADSGVLADSQRDLNPARSAAQVVAAVLRDEGITVKGRPKAAVATGDEIARVTSAPLRESVQFMLETSDNDVAEVLAHHLGAAIGEPTFAGGARATLSTLAELGIPTAAVELYDGSGLSRANLITAETLTATLREAVANPDMAALTYGMPVAGFSGSLTERFLEKEAAAGLGMVWAKTGTLTGVSALAGYVTDRDGVTMTVVILADQVEATTTIAARSALDRAAAALAGCRCAAPSQATVASAPTSATSAPAITASNTPGPSDQLSATVSP